MAEQETKKENQFAVMLQQNLTATLLQKAASLPKNFNQTKFVQNCLTAIEDIDDIENVEVSTIVKGLMKGAILGLDLNFFNLASKTPTFFETLEADLKKLKKINFKKIGYKPSASWFLKENNYADLKNGVYDSYSNAEEGGEDDGYSY